MTNYLLEIGLEEIPAHLVTPSINQLAERMETFLKENYFEFDKIILSVFFTPILTKQVPFYGKQNALNALYKI